MTREEFRQKYGTHMFALTMENTRSVFTDLETAIDEQEKMRAEIDRLKALLADEDRKLRDKVAMLLLARPDCDSIREMFDAVEFFMAERKKRDNL